MKSESVETKTASFWQDEDNILHVKYKGLESVQIEHAITDIETCIKMAEKLPVLTVVDISPVKSVSSEARELYSSSKSKKVFTAVALITATPISRVMGNFFLGINKPPIPVKLFMNKQDAITWLKTMR